MISLPFKLGVGSLDFRSVSEIRGWSIWRHLVIPSLTKTFSPLLILINHYWPEFIHLGVKMLQQLISIWAAPSHFLWVGAWVLLCWLSQSSFMMYACIYLEKSLFPFFGWKYSIRLSLIFYFFNPDFDNTEKEFGCSSDMQDSTSKIISGYCWTSKENWENRCFCSCCAWKVVSRLRIFCQELHTFICVIE